MSTACQDKKDDALPDPIGAGKLRYWVDSEGRGLDINTRSLNNGGPASLFVVRGKRTKNGYVATKLAPGTAETDKHGLRWRMGPPCDGEMRWVDDTLHISTTGSRACDDFRGLYRPPGMDRKASIADWVQTDDKKPGPMLEDTECRRIVKCACDLAQQVPENRVVDRERLQRICKIAKNAIELHIDDEGYCDAKMARVRVIAKSTRIDLPAHCK